MVISSATILVGGVMCLIAAFRQSILWGVGYLLLPFASLVFLVVHWREAKQGFTVSMVGFACFLIVVFSASGARELVATNARLPWLASGKARTLDLSKAIEEQREHILNLQDEFSRVTAEASRQYNVLSDRRKALNIADQPAVHQFNLDAAQYKRQNDRLQQITREIESGNTELSRLNAQRASEPAGKKVVIYTTSSCPACIAAKQYLTSKGIGYQEIDVEQSASGREDFQRLGGTGVPLIVVGEKRMTGFSPTALDAML